MSTLTPPSSPETIARVLVEALPYIQALSGRTLVIKYGGNAMVDAGLKAAFAQDIVLLRQVGVNPVVVHGGGPQIGAVLARIGKETAFVGGMRVTDAETMEVVEMVLGGLVNKEIVSLINGQGGRAVGLSGKDGGLIHARPLRMARERGDDDAARDVSGDVDLGQVGEVAGIDPSVLQMLEGSRFIPVIAPIGVDTAGRAFNINADLVAGTVAGVLKAAKLVLLTNTPGILDRDGARLATLDAATVDALIETGVISGGMLPKVRAALDAVNSGIGAAHIIDGRIPHALLLELLTREGIGTLIGRRNPQG